MRKLIFIAALGVSAAAMSAAAQTATPSGAANAGSATASAKTSPNDATNAKICKSVTEGGTHIPKRECHTQAEWDQIRADAQTNLSDTSHPNSTPH